MKVVYNAILGGWYIVRGAHQTPISGRFDSKEAALDQEKFAELIVQKCADIGQQYADGNYEVPNQILEYFGMQEPEE